MILQNSYPNNSPRQPIISINGYGTVSRFTAEESEVSDGPAGAVLTACMPKTSEVSTPDGKKSE